QTREAPRRDRQRAPPRVTIVSEVRGRMSAVFIRDRKTIESFLAERTARGEDRLDEIWNGVLHLSPPPHHDHGRRVARLALIFGLQAERHSLGDVIAQAGVREPGTPSEGDRANYRVPDLLLHSAESSAKASRSGWIEDGASLVVEVRSPREEFEEKLT